MIGQLSQIVKLGIKFWWLIALIVAGLWLGGFIGTFNRPLFFEPSYPIDTIYQWQGTSWAYPAVYTADLGGNAGGVITIQGVVPITLPDGSLKITKHNDNRAYYETFKKNFDMNKYTEITLTITEKMTANSYGDSYATADYMLLLDNKIIDALRVHAKCVGGGCAPVADVQTQISTILLKKSAAGWTTYKNGIMTITTINLNPTLVFEFSGDTIGGVTNTELTIVGAFKTSTANFAPIAPAAPSLASFAAVLKGWLQKLLDVIPFLTITGSASPVLGTSQTYTASITPPLAQDVDYADGTYAVRYCNVALMRSDGTIITEKGFEACTNAAYPQSAYSTSFNTQIPTQTGKYAVVAVMVESRGTFDATTQAWTFAPYEIIAQEALNIETKAPLPGSTLPLKPASSNIFARIWQSLFGWLFR